MGHRTDLSAPPAAPLARLTGPSYAARILTAAADELDRSPDDILTEPRWRGHFALAVAKTVAQHPTAVADNAAEIAWLAAPEDAAGRTHADYAALLRQAAGRIPQPNPITAEPATVTACRADYTGAARVRLRMDQQAARHH